MGLLLKHKAYVGTGIVLVKLFSLNVLFYCFPVVQHLLQGHRPVGHLLRVRRPGHREHVLPGAGGVEADGHLHHRLRGGPGQELAEDQHAPPVGRNDPHLRGRRQADALLRQENTTARTGSQDRREYNNLKTWSLMLEKV